MWAEWRHEWFPVTLSDLCVRGFVCACVWIVRRHYGDPCGPGWCCLCDRRPCNEACSCIAQLKPLEQKCQQREKQQKRMWTQHIRQIPAVFPLPTFFSLQRKGQKGKHRGRIIQRGNITSFSISVIFVPRGIRRYPPWDLCWEGQISWCLKASLPPAEMWSSSCSHDWNVLLHGVEWCMCDIALFYFRIPIWCQYTGR